MPAITSLGIGSGLDINTMVSQLVALEKRPLVAMQNEAKSLQTQVSSYGQLSSLFGTLQTAASKLTSASLWNRSLATSSDEAAVSLIGGSTAAAGSYSVSVDKLATSQTVVSATSYASAAELVGEGTLTLELGSWDLPPMNFVPQVGRTPLEVEVTATDTLSTLRDKINGLGGGVTASIVSDSSGARLSLRSTATGAENGFRLSAADGDGVEGAGLSRFAFDPGAGGTQMEQKVAASNARATVNGIAVESPSNEMGTVIDGLTLKLRKESFGTAEISVTTDREAVKTAIKDFAEAYNGLTKAISDQTKYDAASKTGGPLQGDSAATGLLRQLRNLFNTSSGASTAFPRLSDIGLEMQRDGTMKVDSGKLDTAAANLPELKKAFANNDTLVVGNNGFARRYGALASQVLGTDGSLTTRTEGLRERISKNGEDQAKLSDRVDRYQARLVAQYTAMDANLSKLTGLQNYVTAQLAALNKSNNTN